MLPLRRLSLLLVVFAVFGPAAPVPAAEIWDGNFVSYTQPAADPGDPANWDRISAAVAITRDSSQGLFNPLSETFADFDTSPAGTAWAFTLNNTGVAPEDITASNFAALVFEPMRTAAGGFPRDVVGLPGVLHLIDEDIYLDFTITSWRRGRGEESGFAWTRASAIPEPATGALVAFGCVCLAGASRRRKRRRRSAG